MSTQEITEEPTDPNVGVKDNSGTVWERRPSRRMSGHFYWYDNQFRYDNGDGRSWGSLLNHCAPLTPFPLTHLPERAEPEDATDLDTLGGLPADDDTPAVRAFVESRVKEDLTEDADDVEPEPLKEGDWVQAWVQVSNPKPDKDGEIMVSLPAQHMVAAEYIRADAIVRPDAGQVPPWVKPAEEPEPSASEVIMAVLTQSSAEMARRMQVFADAAEEFGRRLREQIEGRHDTEGGAS